MPVDTSVCIPCPQAPAELFASEPRQGIVEVSCACAFHCAQRHAFNDASASMLRQKARPDVTAKQVYAQGGAHPCSQHAPAERRISTQAEFAPGQALGARNYATGSNRANRSSAWHPMSPDMLAYPGSYLPGAAPGAGRHRNVPGTGPSKGCRAAGRTSPRADRNSARRATSCSVQPAAQALSPAQQQYRSTATVLLPATYTHALSSGAQASEAAQGPQRMLALARFSAQRYAGRGTAASDCESNHVRQPGGTHGRCEADHNGQRLRRASPTMLCCRCSGERALARSPAGSTALLSRPSQGAHDCAQATQPAYARAQDSTDRPPRRRMRPHAPPPAAKLCARPTATAQRAAARLGTRPLAPTQPRARPRTVRACIRARYRRPGRAAPHEAQHAE